MSENYILSPFNERLGGLFDVVGEAEQGEGCRAQYLRPRGGIGHPIAEPRQGVAVSLALAVKRPRPVAAPKQPPGPERLHQRPGIGAGVAAFETVGPRELDPQPAALGARPNARAERFVFIYSLLEFLRFRAPCAARVISGTLRWAERAGHGTMIGCATPRGLSGTYHLAWRDFPSQAPMSLGRLRYLLIDIS